MSLIRKFLFPNPFTFHGEGEPEITAEQVEKFLEANKDSKEVQATLKKLNPMTEDQVKDYLEDDDDGKKLAQRIFDKRVSESTKKFEKNFKEEKLPSLIEAEYKKKHPEESDEQKANRKLAEKVEALEKENKETKLRNTALELIQEAELPFTSLVDTFVGEDAESTATSIQKFKDVFDDAVDKKVKKVMADSNGREPGGGDKKKTDVKTLEKEYDEAKKSGNVVQMVKIKQQMHESKLKKVQEENNANNK